MYARACMLIKYYAHHLCKLYSLKWGDNHHDHVKQMCQALSGYCSLSGDHLSIIKLYYITININYRTITLLHTNEQMYYLKVLTFYEGCVWSPVSLIPESPQHNTLNLWPADLKCNYNSSNVLYRILFLGNNYIYVYIDQYRTWNIV